jgi:hypothetical protein
MVLLDVETCAAAEDRLAGGGVGGADGGDAGADRFIGAPIGTSAIRGGAAGGGDAGRVASPASGRATSMRGGDAAA